MPTHDRDYVTSLFIRRRLQRQVHLTRRAEFRKGRSITLYCAFSASLVSGLVTVLPDLFRFSPDHGLEQALVRRPPQSGQQFRETHVHFVIASLDYVPCTSSKEVRP